MVGFAVGRGDTGALVGFAVGGVGTGPLVGVIVGEDLFFLEDFDSTVSTDNQSTFGPGLFVASSFSVWLPFVRWSFMDSVSQSLHVRVLRH